MSITDVSRLVQDFSAVVAAITPKQIDILTSLQAVIDERINELNEDIANGDSQENDGQEA